MERALFDEFAENYDPWFLTPVGKKVFELELDLLNEVIKPEEGKSLLDVGIGTGIFSQQLREKGLKITGIDPSEKMLEIAKKRGFEVKKGTGENIPFPDRTFDFVLAMTSIEFSKEPENFVLELVRVAKPGGKIVISVLNLWSLYGLSRRMKGIFQKSLFKGAHFYSYRELESLLKKYTKYVNVSSSVFFNPSPPQWVLNKAENIEKFGRRHLKYFGALLVGCGIKEE